jgi:hypothetical protein
MIRLDLKREPYWLDLGHGVRVYVRPCTTALVMAARSSMLRDLGTTTPGERTATLLRALARLAINAWEGVGGAEGQPAELSAAGVDALMDLWPMAEAFERLYFAPALLLDEEKNG